MPRKSQKDDTAEDAALWPLACTHALLVLLDEHVKKNHCQSPTQKDVKVIAKNILGICYKRYALTQIKSKYFRMGKIYNTFKKLINHTGFRWDFESNTSTCPADVWQEYCKVIS